VVLGFQHADGALEQRDARVWLAEPDAALGEHESLLGRDLLAACRLTFVQGELVQLEPR
jgi:hypothetical protein